MTSNPQESSGFAAGNIGATGPKTGAMAFSSLVAVEEKEEKEADLVHDKEGGDDDDNSGVCCNACGFESSFVPEGMLTCHRCGDVHYCSIDCLNWDWKSGGHSLVCVNKRCDHGRLKSETPADAASQSSSSVQTDPPLEEQHNAAPDDTTIVSMDIANVFSEGETPSTQVTDRRQIMAQMYKQKQSAAAAAEAALGPSQDADDESSSSPAEAMEVQGSKTTTTAQSLKSIGSNSSKLTDFFQSQNKENGQQQQSAPPQPKKSILKPSEYTNEEHASEDSDEDESDEDRSIEFVEADHDNETVLHSIVEETSVSDEPVSEGSWRSRDHFATETATNIVANSLLGVTSGGNDHSETHSEEILGAMEEEEEEEDSDPSEADEILTTTSSLHSGYKRTAENAPPLGTSLELDKLDNSKRSRTVSGSGGSVGARSVGSLDSLTRRANLPPTNNSNPLGGIYAGNADQRSAVWSQHDSVSVDSSTSEKKRKADDSEQGSEGGSASFASETVESNDTTVARMQKKSGPDDLQKDTLLDGDGVKEPNARLNLPESNSTKNGSTGSISKALMLKDFRSAYSSTDSNSVSSSRLKDFHQVYHENSTASVTGDHHSVAETASLAMSIASEDKSFLFTKSVASTDRSQRTRSSIDRKSVASADRSQSTSSVSSSQKRLESTEALKISINKALRDYEMLYGEDAARIAVQRLTQAAFSSGQAILPSPKEVELKVKDSASKDSASRASKDTISEDSTMKDSPLQDSLPKGATEPRKIEARSEKVALEPQEFSGAAMPNTDQAPRQTITRALSEQLSRASSEESFVLGTDRWHSDSRGPPREYPRSKSISSWAMPTEFDFSIASISRHENEPKHDYGPKVTRNGQDKPFEDYSTSFHVQDDSGDDILIFDGNEPASPMPFGKEKVAIPRSLQSQLLAPTSTNGSAIAGTRALQVTNSNTKSERQGQQEDDQRDHQDSGEDDIEESAEEESSDSEGESFAGQESDHAQISGSEENSDEQEVGQSDGQSEEQSEDQSDELSEDQSEEHPQDEHPTPTSVSLSTSGPGDSGPRYLKYRAMLAKSAVAVASAARVLEFSDDENNTQREGTGSTSPMSSPLSNDDHSDEGPGPSAVNVTPTVESTMSGFYSGIQSSVSRAQSDEESDEENDPSLIPRYLQYRTTLAKRMTGTKPKEQESPSRHDGERTLESITVSSMSFDLYTNSMDMDESILHTVSMDESNALSTVGLTSPESFLNSSRSESSQTPKYLEYRSTLAQRLSKDRSTSDRARRSDDDDFNILQEKLTVYLSKSETGNPPLTPIVDAPPIVESASPASLRWTSSNSSFSESPENRKLLTSEQSRRLANALAASASPSGIFRARPEEPRQVAPSPVVRKEAPSPVVQSQEPERFKVEQTPRAREINFARSDSSLSHHDSDVETGFLFSRKESLNASDSERERASKITRCRRNMLWGFGLFVLITAPLSIGLGVSLPDASSSSLRAIIVPPEEPTTAPSFEAPSSSPRVIIGTNPTSMPTFGGIPPISIAPSGALDAPSVSPSYSSMPSESPRDAPSSFPSFSLAPSTFPSASQTFPDERVLDLLILVSSDAGQRLLQRNTPQNEAYFWLIDTDTDGLSDERIVQRYALATFFFSTAGDSWIDNSGWLSEDNECDWFSRSIGLEVCDALGFFVNLDLGFNGLGGSIPAEVGLLRNLTRIDLSGGTSGAHIGGSLPSELSLLRNVESFNIRDNMIAGQLPEGLNWNDATLFDVSDNRLSGSIPEDIGMMTSLTALQLSINQFSGSLTSAIGQLTELVTLNLEDNLLTGALPDSVGDLTQVERINFARNRFSELSSQVGRLVGLVTFEMQENNLSGNLFDDWSSLESLEILDLHQNKIIGKIPPSLGQLSTLLILDLSKNRLTGPIPGELGGLTTVFNLFLQDNLLTGGIPMELEGLQVVSLLRLDGNNLQGRVPPEVCLAFGVNAPKFYSDCDGANPEILCPVGACCSYCCEDGVGCRCVFEGIDAFDHFC